MHHALAVLLVAAPGRVVLECGGRFLDLQEEQVALIAALQRTMNARVPTLPTCRATLRAMSMTWNRSSR